MKALPANIPYVNLLLLNVVQAIIAIFLASDFLKRDKKLDTTDVIYVRPMTNGEYVMGKTIGNLGVFLVLNLIIFVITSYSIHYTKLYEKSVFISEIFFCFSMNRMLSVKVSRMINENTREATSNQITDL